ncbi:hypothetical protein N658DRAFT_426965 [Parathielavia hyrcaniae]|uniref:PAS domain-containing protein n=1 Tax=Parathielavia hyrcaniae TaxID=113614 RepID=A0AAN6PZG6_9PEZI|nr:hypothetical protein N658DRAFT_426965 [Parathielavia hyrcaniae]
MDPRDQTFMTIHNLTPDANILFASDSILDILGYQPDEVRGKSAFDYFHPDEVPFARSIHSRGILLDKAAVLHYARILSKTGQWVGCECCFTVVHNVLVASTSIYLRGERSERRARDAPQIRRIFSSSPRDPRYQMLEHLSPKFKMPPMEREPRAALILNRFTRNLTIMYATDAVAQILGARSDELLERPFYECIQPNCLEEAERCLESAKANESIAYLRFWYKDPRIDPNDAVNEDEVDDMEDDIDDRSSLDESETDSKDPSLRDRCMDLDEEPGPRTREEDEAQGQDGELRSGTRVPTPQRCRSQSPRVVELEAVVSCTSDGLVVVLRRARPPIPDPQPPLIPAAFNFENGLFAAPWGVQPIEPYISPELLYTFRPPLLPQYMPLRECVKAAGGPPIDQLMRSIRDVAVFAWAVTGINPTLANYGQGRPRISAPPPVPTTYPPPEDLSASSSSSSSDVPKEPAFGRAAFYPPPEAPGPPPSYRTRHASLDENMYDAGTAGFHGLAPYHYGGSGGGGGGGSGYEPGGYSQHGRRPPLRPAFSYDALQGHARLQHQPQQQPPPQPQPQPQQGCYTPSAAEVAARRCNLGDEPWTAGARYAARGPLRRAGDGAGGGGGSVDESSKAAAAAAGRYFW